MRDTSNDDRDHETPPAVVTAVGLATVPLPVIGIYAVTFLVHGSFSPVSPPDITGSLHGEFIVGWIALAAFVVAAAALVLFLNRTARWPFAAVQLATLGMSVYFLVDGTKGGNAFTVLMAVASAVAVVLAFLPPAWAHMDAAMPDWLRRAYDAVPTPRRGTPAGAPPVGPSVGPAVAEEPVPVSTTAP